MVKPRALCIKFVCRWQPDKDIKYIAINRVPLVNLVLLDLLTE